jgi:hypothetical protein
VICGDRDNSPVRRGVRVAGPRAPASTLIRTDVAPKIIAPSVISLAVRLHFP